jgi:trigger factor
MIGAIALEVHTSKLPGSRLELKLQLSAQEVDGAYSKVFDELSAQGGIPGFRPGRAPAKIIRRRVDEKMLQEMAWVRLLEDQYPKLLENEGLEPLEDPQFPELDDVPLAEGTPLEFSFTLTVRPQPQIRQYKGLELIKPSAEVTEQDVDNYVRQFVENAAEEVEVERDLVADGDIVNVGLKVIGESDDEPLSEDEQEFFIGKGTYDPPIDQELLGKRVGETITIEHQYPDDYAGDAELAGKQVTIHATIAGLKERRVPELTDELVKQQTDGDMESVEELRESVRQNLAQQFAQQAEQELEQNALAAILSGTEVDLPETLVEGAAAESFERFQDDLQRENLSLEAFMDIAQVDESTIRQNERSRAETMLKLNLALGEIRRLEEIEISDEDLDAEIAHFAESTGQEESFVRNFLELQEDAVEQFRERALRNKIIKFIVENCEATEIPRDQYEDTKLEQRRKLQEMAEAARSDADEAVAADEATGTDDAAATEEAVDTAEQASDDTDTEPEASAADVADTELAQDAADESQEPTESEV